MRSGGGPWQPAQRYWHGNAPELDVVARSVDGRRLLVGEAKWTDDAAPRRGASRPGVPPLAAVGDCEIHRALFLPQAAAPRDAASGAHLVEARTVMAVLR